MFDSPNVTDLIFGGELPGLGDPTEEYVEASKLHRSLSALEVPGVFLLESNPWLIESTARAGRHVANRPRLDLPASAIDERSGDLAAALRSRRSPELFAPSAAPTLDELSAWCWATAGVNGAVSTHHQGRTYPSGGAMFPCDLFVSLDEVPGDQPAGTYYYAPAEHALFHVADARPGDLAETTAQPESFTDGTAVWVVAAAIWRSRFKYGQRALRFALLEAGHMAQNLLLATTSTGHAARPIGGFFDDEVNALLHLDGIHDVPLYLVVSGRPAPVGEPA